MDGVLYDSMPNHAYAWEHSTEKFGLKMTQAEAYQFEGMRGVETIKIIAQRQWGRLISDAESQEIYDEKSAIYASRPEAKIMPGVMDLQRQMKADGAKIVVVTGSGQRSLLQRLLRDFDGLVSRELMVTSFDVSRGKPQPDPYLMGLQKAGVSADEAMVVENAPLGVRAGKAAGIFTVAVNTGPLPDQELWEAGADLVFPDMYELHDWWNNQRDKAHV